MYWPGLESDKGSDWFEQVVQLARGKNWTPNQPRSLLKCENLTLTDNTYAHIGKLKYMWKGVKGPMDWKIHTFIHDLLGKAGYKWDRQDRKSWRGPALSKEINEWINYENIK